MWILSDWCFRKIPVTLFCNGDSKTNFAVKLPENSCRKTDYQKQCGKQAGCAADDGDH